MQLSKMYWIKFHAIALNNERRSYIESGRRIPSELLNRMDNLDYDYWKERDRKKKLGEKRG